MKIRRQANSAIIFCFLILLILPLLGLMLGNKTTHSKDEKRAMAPMPVFPASYRELQEYPKKFEDFFKDHFGLRSKLVYANNLIKANLGVSPSGKVLLGKDGWFFYNIDKVINDYRNVSPLSKDQLEYWQKNLMEKSLWLKERGIQYVFVIAPNKHTIYSEFLPESLVKINPYSRMDQLIAYMKESELPLIDLRPVLLSYKKKNPVYFKTDSHWNLYGSYGAHLKIIEEMRRQGSEIAPMTIEDNEFIWTSSKGGDLTVMLKLEETIEEIRPSSDLKMKTPLSISHDGKRIVIENNSNTEKETRLLMFHDSFGGYLKPYFSRYFKESIYSNERASFKRLSEYVQRYKPNVVIEERVERSFR